MCVIHKQLCLSIIIVRFICFVYFALKFKQQQIFACSVSDLHADDLNKAANEINEEFTKVRLHNLPIYHYILPGINLIFKMKLTLSSLSNFIDNDSSFSVSRNDLMIQWQYVEKFDRAFLSNGLNYVEEMTSRERWDF